MSRDHIICVDDEEGVLVALRQQLQRFSDECQIDLARSGHDALELMDELQRDGESVALVTRGVSLDCARSRHEIRHQPQSRHGQS